MIAMSCRLLPSRLSRPFRGSHRPLPRGARGAHSLLRAALTAVLGATAALGSVAMPLAQAADATYPNRPVRLVIPQSPGGGSDSIGRLIAQRLSENFGQSFIVDNRPGAAGMLGADLVRQANADGYTLLLSAIDTITAPLVTKNAPFDPIRDFAPVTQLTESANIWLVNPTFAAKSMKELIDIVRAKPQQIDYASSGIGSMQHLGGELLNQMAKVQLAHIPYKGGGPALLDLLGGRVPVMVSGTQAALPHIRTGKARALAVTSSRRSSALPDVPTVAEALGLKGYEALNWQGLFAPAATPRPVVTRIANEAIKILGTPDVRARLAELGFDPVGNTPAEFAQVVVAEQKKWLKLIQSAGIKAE
jgi:tripartite-type tricarboxylate transporter receptor subunit TctC